MISILNRVNLFFYYFNFSKINKKKFQQDEQKIFEFITQIKKEKSINPAAPKLDKINPVIFKYRIRV